MNHDCFNIVRGVRLGLFLLLGIAAVNRFVIAYPPAPYHLIFGMLRDEYGTPLNLEGAEVYLETSAGIKIKTRVIPGIESSANYRLEVPMDTGLSGPLYLPTALQPMAPFRVKARIGGVTYVPMEMNGNFAALGQPGKRTRLNLTLGEDTDGDGLPDAWERLFNSDISAIHPGASAGNRMNYLDSYLAGVFTGDPTAGFTLTVARLEEGAPILEFLAAAGRTYALEGSNDLKTWQKLRYRLTTDSTTAARSSYLAASTSRLQILVLPEADAPPAAYFRLIVH